MRIAGAFDGRHCNTTQGQSRERNRGKIAVTLIYDAGTSRGVSHQAGWTQRTAHPLVHDNVAVIKRQRHPVNRRTRRTDRLYARFIFPPRGQTGSWQERPGLAGFPKSACGAPQRGTPFHRLGGTCGSSLPKMIIAREVGGFLRTVIGPGSGPDPVAGLRRMFYYEPSLTMPEW